MHRKSKPRRSPTSDRSPLVEPLEGRRLMAAVLDLAAGNAWYDGSAVGNNLTVSYANGVYTLTDTAEVINLHDRAKDRGATGDGTHTVTFAADEAAAIYISTADGSDTVNILSSNRHIGVSAGGGFFNTVNIGDNGNTDGVDGLVSVSSTGSTSINIDDSANTAAKNVNVSNYAVGGGLGENSGVLLGDGVTALSVKMGSANDTHVKVDITDSRDLASLSINTGNGANGVRVEATTATMATNINTQGGAFDTINIGDGDTSDILGPVNITDSVDAVQLVIDDQHGDAAHNVAINNGLVTGAAPGAITYGPGVTNLIMFLNAFEQNSDTISFNHSGGDLKTAALSGGDGADTFNITPSSTVNIGIGGGLPVAPTTNGDNLVLNLAGVTGADLNLNADKHSGTWTFSDRKTITFAGIESYDASNLKETIKSLGLPAGHENAALAKLDLKGNVGDAAKVEAFIEFVGTLLDQGEITAAQADALIVQANLLLQSL